MTPAIHSKNRLQDRVDTCWVDIEGHRLARREIFKAYIGDNYGLSPSGQNRVALNGHALYARSLLLYLAAHQPGLLINTDVGPWKKYMEAVRFQTANVMRSQRFGFKQQRWVLDALLYSPGILKVAQEWHTVPTGEEGDNTSVLQTFVSNVDTSDHVYDTGGSSVYDTDFAGHRFRPKVEDILANPMFAKVDRDELMSLSGSGIGTDDDRLFFEKDDRMEEYYPKVPCYEIYDRCTDRLKIWPVDRPSLMLYDEPWEGRKDGPLLYLDFLDVPNHVVGLSPLCILHNLIEATNRALTKTIQQTDSAKNIFTFTSGDPDEAETLMESRDGWGVWKHGGGLQEVLNVPGPDARTMAMVPYLRELYNWLGGNINELAGLGVSAPTATQGKLMAEAASGMVKFMQARTHEAVRSAVEAMVHNELQDQVNTEVMPVSLADGSTYWRRFTPEQRNAIDAILINIDIDVHSMRYRSPEDRMNGLREWWNTFARPGYQIWKSQGGEYDMQALNRIWAEYEDLPEIREIAIDSMQPGAEQVAGSDSPVPLKQSPVTSRTNIRMDRGGGPGPMGGEMAQTLLGMEAG